MQPILGNNEQRKWTYKRTQAIRFVLPFSLVCLPHSFISPLPYSIPSLSSFHSSISWFRIPSFHVITPSAWSFSHLLNSQEGNLIILYQYKWIWCVWLLLVKTYNHLCHLSVQLLEPIHVTPLERDEFSKRTTHYEWYKHPQNVHYGMISPSKTFTF